MTGKAGLPGVEWVLATMIAVALIYGFAPWPTPQVTRQLLLYLYPQCFLPIVRCLLPVEKVRLAAYAGLVAITYAAILAAYCTIIRAVARRSSSETVDNG